MCSPHHLLGGDPGVADWTTAEAGRTTAEATATGTRSAFILAGVIPIFALIGSFFVTRVREPVESVEKTGERVGN